MKWLTLAVAGLALVLSVVSIRAVSAAREPEVRPKSEPQTASTQTGPATAPIEPTETAEASEDAALDEQQETSLPTMIVLYRSASDGEPEMICTVTAFRKEAGRVWFFTVASGCVLKEGDDVPRLQDDLKWYVAVDDGRPEPDLIPARLDAVGDPKTDADFAVLSADLGEAAEEIEIIEFGAAQ